MAELEPQEQTPPSELTWGRLAAWLRQAWQQVRAPSMRHNVTFGLLLLILLLAAVLRFTGLNWDEHQHLHPDERFLTMVENSLTWPTSLAQYWDSSQNPLNPYNHDFGSYVYGLLPLVVAKLFGQITGYTGYDGVYLVGRVLSGIMDIMCVYLVYLIGRRLYNRRVGLLGALLLAVSVLSIQHSHFFTVDSYTTFFATLSLYMAVRVAQGEKGWTWVGLGLAFGLAVSTKISVLSFVGIIGLAYCLRVAQAQPEAPTESGGLRHEGRLGRMHISLEVTPDPEAGPAPTYGRYWLPVGKAILAMVGVLLVAAVVFRIVQPQAFNGPGFFGLSINARWLSDMSSISELVSGKIDYPPSDQWTARPAVWYAFKNMLLWGQGVPLGLAVWAGWGLMAFQMLRRRKWNHLLPWAWMTFTFFYQSVQFVKTVRYMLPIYPRWRSSRPMG